MGFFALLLFIVLWRADWADPRNMSVGNLVADPVLYTYSWGGRFLSGRMRNESLTIHPTSSLWPHQCFLGFLFLISLTTTARTPSSRAAV
jgi:hypothetical protein